MKILNNSGINMVFTMIYTFLLPSIRIIKSTSFNKVSESEHIEPSSPLWQWKYFRADKFLRGKKAAWWEYDLNFIKLNLHIIIKFLNSTFVQMAFFKPEESVS